MISTLKFAVAVVLGIISVIWLESVGISVIGSITIAVPVIYGWYKIMAGEW